MQSPETCPKITRLLEHMSLDITLYFCYTYSIRNARTCQGGRTKMAVTVTQTQIECRNPECENLFTPRNAQHGFCCEKCRRAARGTQWRIIRKAALRRDRYICQDCTDTACSLEVHHILPLCKGGSNNLYNLLTLCRRCHRLRHRTWKLVEVRGVIDALRQGQKCHAYTAA